MLFFFFNDTATTEIYTLSLHDALPIYLDVRIQIRKPHARGLALRLADVAGAKRNLALQICEVHNVEIHEAESAKDRKSTRLNSSHLVISYAVFCLKKTKE